MATIFDVAKFILDQEGPIDQQKLQSLCYYAQAWSLAINGEPLFSEKFVADLDGPKCLELEEVIVNTKSQ